MRGQQVKEVTATSQFCYYEELVVDAKDVKESNDVAVASELP